LEKQATYWDLKVTKIVFLCIGVSLTVQPSSSHRNLQLSWLLHFKSFDMQVASSQSYSSSVQAANGEGAKVWELEKVVKNLAQNGS